MKIFIALFVAGLFSVGSFAKEIDASKSTFKWKADKKIGDGHWGNIQLKSATAKFDGDKIVNGENKNPSFIILFSSKSDLFSFFSKIIFLTSCFFS